MNKVKEVKNAGTLIGYISDNTTFYPLENCIPIEEWIANGGVIEEEFTPEELAAQDQAVAKVARTEALANLTVEVNEHVFDANETARTNMMAAILSADLIGKTEESWKLSDNSTETITLNELKQALALAIQAVGEIVKGERL